MKLTRLSIPDIILIEPDYYFDERGYFSEYFRDDLFYDFSKINTTFCQDNISKSSKNVFRGLHYQLSPKAQSKLVKVIKGSIIDVIVDIRKGSNYFGKSLSLKLSENNQKQVFIPRGFAHGFYVKSKIAIISYKVDNYYCKELDRSINVLDNNLGINSIPDNVLLSDKDKFAPNFLDADKFNINEKLYK